MTDQQIRAMTVDAIKRMLARAHRDPVTEVVAIDRADLFNAPYAVLEALVWAYQQIDGMETTIDCMTAHAKGQAARIEELEQDRARMEWYFGDFGKVGWVDTYLSGIRERWSVDQWRAAIDKELQKEERIRFLETQFRRAMEPGWTPDPHDCTALDQGGAVFVVQGTPTTPHLFGDRTDEFDNRKGAQTLDPDMEDV